MVRAVLLLLLLCLPGAAAAQATAHGTWITDGGKGRVEIRDCGGRLCGAIVWLRDPLDEQGRPRSDRNNPDASLRARPIVGLQILQGFLPASEPGRWDGGTIYNPEDGETYRCTLTLQGPDTLLVRGYVGLPLLGRTQTWIRAPAP